MPSKITPEVIAEYNNGVPLAELLAKYGISKTQFYRRLKSEQISKRGPPPRFDEATWKLIGEEYASGVILTDLAEQYQSATWTLSQGLRDRGYRIRTTAEALRKYTDCEIDDCIEKYLAGESARSAGELCGASEPTVLRWLNDHDIQRRHQANYGGNYLFFQNIDSEATAYWFGFLCADGNIMQNKYIRVLLSSKDIDHLLLFQQTIDYHKPIDVYKRVRYWKDRPPKEYEYAKSLIGCRVMVDHLINHGLRKTKRGDIEPFKRIPDELYHHFLRGYFDGDGSIYQAKYKPGIKVPFWQFYICDNHQSIVEYLMSRCPVVKRHNARKSNKNECWYVSYGGNQIVPRICKWLYQDATVYLPRKKILADMAIGRRT